jgi:hypothetical protein
MAKKACLMFCAHPHHLGVAGKNSGPARNLVLRVFTHGGDGYPFMKDEIFGPRRFCADRIILQEVLEAVGDLDLTIASTTKFLDHDETKRAALGSLQPCDAVVRVIYGV